MWVGTWWGLLDLYGLLEEAPQNNMHHQLVPKGLAATSGSAFQSEKLGNEFS